MHTIDPTAWIDFSASQMNRTALANLLQNSADAAGIAVSNIPYSKTILARHIVQSLDDDLTDSDDPQDKLEGAAWMSAIRSNIKTCASLSAFDLAQLAQETGFRVELSWARQRTHHGALDAVFHHYKPNQDGGRVLVQFPTDNRPRLSGQLTNQPLQRLQSRRLETQIRDQLSAVLASYMIPSLIVMVDEMPLNANGKVDRKALERRARMVQKVEKPASERLGARNEIEAALCEVFVDLLGTEVGITDNFFNLGGHSLMATKLAARISRRLDARISVKDVFDYPVLADLAGAVQRGSTPHNPIVATPYSGPVDQSFAQGRLWFLDQLNAGSLWYIQPIAVRVRGSLNIGALTTALNALEQRHEPLRTTFEEHDGVGVQVIQPHQPKKLRIVDTVADYQGDFIRALRKEQQTLFNLATEPGWRVSLLRIGEDDNILSIVMHHIISDGWSVDILRQDLKLFYAAALKGQEPQVDALPIQYRDFAFWQKQPEQVAEHQRQLDYWIEQLKDSTPAELITDFPRPEVLSGTAGIVQLAVDGQVYERLRAFCRIHQTTSFAVLLAAFRAAHYRLTGTEDATIGSPIANRNRPELESLIGFFVNTQCMRIMVGGDDTFERLVQQVRSTTTAAFANQDVPFERIVSSVQSTSRDASRNPLVQLMFVLHSQQGIGLMELEGVETEPIARDVSTRFDIEFHLYQKEESLHGVVHFAADLFEPETIQGLVSVFQEILRRGLETPRMPISVLPLDNKIPELLVGMLDVDTPEYPRDSSVVDVFRTQVAASPDAIAAKDSTSQLTYAQLDEESNKVATWLRQRQLAPETLVGVLAPRSCPTIVTFFGILKANLAYLPLDVNVPSARIEAILSAVPGHKLVLLGATSPIQRLHLSTWSWCGSTTSYAKAFTL